MNLAFIKKELGEQFKTPSGYAVILIFGLVGFFSPYLARSLPKILDIIAHSEGIKIDAGVPTYMDAYFQYFKNIFYLMIVFCMFYSQILSTEINRGTMVFSVTKGISRRNILLSKFFVLSVIWFLSVIVSFALANYSSHIFFDFDINLHIFVPVLGMFLLGELFISSIFVGSVYFSGNQRGLIGVLMTFIILSMFSFIPSLNPISPLALGYENVDILIGTKSARSFILAYIATFVLILCTLIMSIKKFQKTSL